MPGLYVFGLFAIATASVTQGHSGCSERGAPDHGRVRVILQRAAGLMVAYSCDPGYLRTGHVYSVCLRGEWTAPLPTCISAKGHSGGKTDGAAGDQGVLVSHQELPSTQRSIVARRVVKTKQTRRKRKRKRKDKRILPPAIEGSDSPTEKSLDTSCLLGTTDGIPKFVRPPKVPNAVGPKFIRKKTGTQKYLVAIYRCVAGYKLHNPHSRSLGCQGGKWVGTLPICLPRRKKIGCINAGCDHGCKEVNGKPKCFCFRGFRQNGKQCFDENECFVDNGGCQQSCHNTPGSFYCGCPPGYRLTNDRSSCVDINECLSRNGHGPCQGQCHNVDGSFVCSCEGFPGSQLADDGVSCADINECNDPVHRLNCSHACVNTRGSAFCLCPLGFEVGADWTTCQDINECERHIAPCDDGCVNTIGSFTCISEGCSTGYVLINGTCEDVDECTANVSICSHSCSNTPGSFTCSCPIGFVLAQDGKTCLDNDECSEFAEGHLCSHICQNTLGSYYCLCPSDHELASDHRTCHPKEDECQRKNCSHDCLIEENHVKCVCDKGYVLENEITCVDIDECEENLANCSHGCDNDEGTFYCTCPTGYSLLTDKKTCVRRDCDLKTCNLEKTEDSNCSCPEVFESNEGNCDNGESLSSQLCRNNEGSVESNCEEGFYLSSDRRSCIDFDECQEETICPSSKTCVNTEGSYLCNCPPGFRDVNGTTFCEDINECTFTIDEGSSLCSHTCINTLGTYHCECPLGYMMGKDSRTCEDIDECSENNEIDTTCSHKCVNSLGSYRCECPEHYKLESDHICVVAGGCDINNGGCSHICIENGEYPICECHKGFILANDNVTCESHLHSCSDGYSYQVTTQQCADINECLENNGNCSQICENIEGSFYCSCFPGFEKIGYSHTCLDINECTNNVSVCDQVCINTEGSYKCGCSAGYTLSESLTECVHIDECVNNTLCDQICKNSDGSFKCECNPGYILSSDGVSCEDVNECILHSSNCSQICKNLDGGFLCECNPGFELVNGSICVEEKNTIKEGYSENGNLIIKGEMKCCCTIGQASNCHQSDNCDLSTSEIVPCLSKIKEEALGCSPLFPDDSSVDLDCKLTTQEDVYHPVGTECRVRCRPGYKLDGVRVTTCLNGTWTGSFQCIAQIRPYIKCPPAIRLNLPLGKNTTTVNIPQPKTNMNWEKHVTSNPSWGKQFQNTLTVGTISVQFSAVSPSSNAVAKCTTSIQVKDVERPTIHGCPEKMEVFVQRGENSAEARWTEPNVTDNVKVAYFYQSKRPGVMLSRGLHEINYIATDSSGNIATCQFTISVEYEK